MSDLARVFSFDSNHAWVKRCYSGGRYGTNFELSIGEYLYEVFYQQTFTEKQECKLAKKLIERIKKDAYNETK